MPEPIRRPVDQRLPLAAILAGGQSRRFGAPKALASLAGQPLLLRVARTIREALTEPVLITGRAELGMLCGLPVRADVIPGGGPLSGIHTALLWAQELGRPGALCVGCDTPFLTPMLLSRLVERFGATPAVGVAPESGGGRLEPLCAVYSLSCLPEVQRRLRSSEHTLQGLLRSLPFESLPLAEVRECGVPEKIFFNVNTPEQLGRAERIARGE
jgi:molybdopterin-guanine dinucleotide biosynthesis protein A